MKTITYMCCLIFTDRALVADITYQATVYKVWQKAVFQGCSTVCLPLSVSLWSPTFPLNRYLVSFPIWWYHCSKSKRSPLQRARWRLSFFQLTLRIARFLGCCIKIKHLTCQFWDVERFLWQSVNKTKPWATAVYPLAISMRLSGLLRKIQTLWVQLLEVLTSQMEFFSYQ